MFERLSIRVAASNPNHHLWLNNGTWYVHYTIHLHDYTKRRIRVSLGTHDLNEARRERDRVLGKFLGEHARVAKETEVAA